MRRPPADRVRLLPHLAKAEDNGRLCMGCKQPVTVVVGETYVLRAHPDAVPMLCMTCARKYGLDGPVEADEDEHGVWKVRDAWPIAVEDHQPWQPARVLRTCIRQWWGARKILRRTHQGGDQY